MFDFLPLRVPFVLFVAYTSRCELSEKLSALNDNINYMCDNQNRADNAPNIACGSILMSCFLYMHLLTVPIRHASSCRYELSQYIAISNRSYNARKIKLIGISIF